MYEKAEPVRSPLSGQTSGLPPQPSRVHQTRIRHGNDASDKLREDQKVSSHTYEEAENVKHHVAYTSAERTYLDGTSGNRDLCSSNRSHRSCLAACIAVLLSLVAVGLAPLTFTNKEEIYQLSTTVDALKRIQYNMSTTVSTLKRRQDDMATTVDVLKRHQDDMRQMSTSLEALKRDLDKERSRTAALDQHLHDIISCPKGYTMWRDVCYKAFNTRKNFSEAAVSCRADGGTLAMPRDAETNVFLVSLYRAVREDSSFWFGLHDQRQEGRFEWVDGSALGTYNSWGPSQPNDDGGDGDCVLYSPHEEGMWFDAPCTYLYVSFICQAAPGIHTSYNRTIS
ncbi:PREDICTED: C-type lectin domain family 3 member A homolog [Branchiostoma belcheri]|uniref:C-type lectin domain family 3 member A homolog n=1 Tax=Branchiostoma belcheri TaxID=7741 RepID=A0A6P4XXP3_BRABE|nr:PREDICTED: C-type lectin domain family 3 member A homolog [Branchiostoma belcheri]